MNIRKSLGRLDPKNLNVLHVGSGRYHGGVGGQMATIPFKRLVAIDNIPANIRALEKRGVAAEVFEPKVRDLMEFLKAKPKNSFDVVVVTKDLPGIMVEADRVAKKAVISPGFKEPEPMPVPLTKEELREVTTYDTADEAIEAPHELAEEEEEDEDDEDDTVKAVLVERIDCQGDVLVATSVLPGLAKKYPKAAIDFRVGRGYDFALQHNPYIRDVLYKNTRRKYDYHYKLEHHYQWNDQMARVHCRIAGVPFNPPELHLTEKELDKAERWRNHTAVAFKAGWKSRQCPNLQYALSGMGNVVQLDNGPTVSSSFEHPTLTLREAAAIMAVSKLYIGIDTVFMHMAVALGKPMVLCMGPTGPEKQYVPNATIIRPFIHTKPAQPHKEFAQGIHLLCEDIEIAIRTKLDEDGNLVDRPSDVTDIDGVRIIQYT